MSKRSLTSLLGTVGTFVLLFPTPSLPASPIESHLANIRDLFLHLQEPAFLHVGDNYNLVRRMQQECDEIERHYALDFSAAALRGAPALDSTIRAHVYLAMAAASVVYEDLYEYHLEIAYARLRRHYGYAEAQKALENILENDFIRPELTLKQAFDQKRAEYESYRNRGRRVEFVLDRSSGLFPVEQFSIVPVPEQQASPAPLLFARSLNLQLQEPIIKHWYLRYFLEEARRQKINIEPTDYFAGDPGDVAKAQWLGELPQVFRRKNPISLSPIVPPGRYHVFARGSAVADPRANLVIPETDLPGLERFTWTMAESGMRVEVRPEPAPQTAAERFFPRFKLLDLQLGANARTDDLEGSVAGQMFHRFNRSLGLQTQAELAFRSHHDHLDLEEPVLGTVVNRPKRDLADFSSTEFQLDIGPVFRHRDVQLALIQSLRYVKRERFEQGGMLGQFFFNVSYLFGRGQAGFYFSKANLDEPVVKRVTFDQVFTEETYLKVVEEVGGNFQIRALKGSHLEGAVGYLYSLQRENTVGGVFRHVFPPLWRNLTLLYEVGYNESLVSPKNSWRFGVGLRFGDREEPSGFRAEEGPVPVFVPRLRFETRTRVVREGNRPPVADAGPDQSDVRPGAKVVLDGTGSFDPDGDALRYEWTQISGEGVVLEDKETATPKFIAGNGQTYVFQLIVVDSHGARSAPDLVTIKTLRVDPPVIVSFLADPAEIRSGQSSTLRYQTRDASRVRITNIDADLPATGAVSVRPSTTTSYTLTAYNAVGESVSATLTVTVKPPLPAIVRFQADPSEIRRGEASVLSWKTTNASRVTLLNKPGDPAVAAEGSLVLQPEITTTFTLVAYNEAGESVSASVTVTVRPPLPVIQSFSAEPSQIRAGQTSVLRWKTANATRVTLRIDGGPEVGVSAEGDLLVQPARTTTYTLTAYNAIGENTSASVTVVVTPF